MTELSQESIENDVLLGKDRSNVQRGLAFLSIVVIYFFYCYNFMVGIFVQPTMLADIASGGFGFTLKQSSEIFAIMGLGTIPGTLVFGMLSARIGKKRTLMTVGVLISATTLIPMLDPTNYELWFAARFLAGFTLGGVFGAAMPLIADMFPGKYRGKLAACLTSLFSLAMIFGGVVYGILGNENWDMLMYTAIIPPIIGAIMTFFFVPDDYLLLKEINTGKGENTEKISYISMYKGKYLWIGIGVILLSGANFTAYSVFSNNATTHLTTELGMSAAIAGSIYSFQGIGQLIGYITWGAISDKFGRKVPAIGMLLSAAFVFAYTTLDATSVSAFMAVSLLIGFAFGFSGAWGAYYTELFPAKFRSLSAGISFNGGRIISTFAIPASAGVVTAESGMLPIFTVSIGVFIAGFVVWILLPETLKKTKKGV